MSIMPIKQNQIGLKMVLPFRVVWDFCFKSIKFSVYREPRQKLNFLILYQMIENLLFDIKLELNIVRNEGT